MKPLRPGLLPVIMLVVIIAWALFAVAMLTGTLVATQRIENRVVAINTTFPMVGENLQSIPLAVETGRIADEIDRVVRPIGPQFTQTVEAVRSIDAGARAITDNVNSINGSVKMINDAVKTIGSTVGSIDSNLSSVNDKVVSINNSAKGIGDSFDGILDEVRSIDDEVAGINTRADTVTDQAREIADNLERVRDVVPDINQNAASIANSPVVTLLDPVANPLMARMQAPLPLPAIVPPVASPLPAVAGSGPLAAAGVLPEAPLLLGPETESVLPDLSPKKRSPSQKDGVLPGLGGLSR